MAKLFDEIESLNQDSNGVYRSKPLPRIRGTILELPAQISQAENRLIWQKRCASEDELIVLDLFSGAGGLSYGFQEAGFFIAAGVDRDKSSILTHAYNFNSESICEDITNIEDPKQFIAELGIPRVDVVIASPPCQGFSTAGKAAIKKLGLEDYYHNVLNELYREFVRFVEVLKPKAFLMENVPTMASFQDGDIVTRIKERFRSIGYTNTDSKILNAKYHGVPQARKRLFIGGTRFGSDFPFPAEKTNAQLVTVRHAISDLPSCQPPVREDEMPYDSVPESAYQKLMREQSTHNIVYDHIIRDVREDDKVIFSLMNEGDKYTDVPEELRRYRSDFKNRYSKMKYDEPSWTVIAHISKEGYRYIHPDNEQWRMLSIREFARLQSFPDHFRFCGAPTRRLQQIGNAVPPLLAKSIADNLYSFLKTHQITE